MRRDELKDRSSGRSVGRPRSVAARDAILEAVAELLVEVGYAATTIKDIAARAGVGRETVYRWWSSRAEILVEACTQSANAELVTAEGGTPTEELDRFLVSVSRFLIGSPSGMAYRALLGEAQHDPAVGRTLGTANVLRAPTEVVLERIRPSVPSIPDAKLAEVQLLGPVLLHVMASGTALRDDERSRHIATLLTGWRSVPAAGSAQHD